VDEEGGKRNGMERAAEGLENNGNLVHYLHVHVAAATRWSQPFLFEDPWLPRIWASGEGLVSLSISSDVEA